MSPVSGARRRKLLRKKSVAIAEMPPAQTVMPYDENLLERARTQWQFGDWSSLTRLDRSTMQHHPAREKLALLAAAGHFQIGDQELARQYVRLAQEWGCSDKLVIQVLAAGVHNNLGCAAALEGNTSRALRQFESAIELGSPGSDSRLMLRARAHEQFKKLGLKAPDSSSEDCETYPRHTVPVILKSRNISQKPPILIEDFLSEIEGDRTRVVEQVRQSFADQFVGEPIPPMDWVGVGHRSIKFFFIHFSGDYIPKKMAEKGQFYESPYLNLLARLHRPGRLIVDGGANIGNHSVFFSGVIGAPVIAFEPQLFNFGCLVTNVHLNRLADKVDVRQIALGEQPGRIKLVQALEGNYGSFTTDASLVQRADGDARAPSFFDAPVATLDAELAEYRDAVSIIKLDLEGMELEALRGARNIIERSLPVIAVECLTQSQYQEIKSFLAAFDYFVIDSTNATPTFIFLTRRSPQHLEMLSKYLEMSSVGKFASNIAFHKPKP